jgi:hypothetical protein
MANLFSASRGNGDSQRVRLDEFVFGVAHRQHGTRRQTDYAFGDAAHHEVRQGAAAVPSDAIEHVTPVPV